MISKSMKKCTMKMLNHLTSRHSEYQMVKQYIDQRFKRRLPQDIYHPSNQEYRNEAIVTISYCLRQYASESYLANNCV